MIELIKKTLNFWDDSKLEKIVDKNEYDGESIAWTKYKQEREEYYQALKTELKANLNPKSW